MPADVIPLLVCEDLVRRFGDVAAVDGVSFGIDHGETYGLIGPNGAGKTTTISMIAGLLAPDRGEARVAGIPIGPTATTAKARIGLVPQDLALYPDLSARENLRFFGRLQGLDRSELRLRVDEVLDLIGLADRADDLAKEYSGGMKRRLNIGIGLLHRPELLILDEPTVGVDPQSRNAILEAIEALSVEGMGVLYTTHYMEEAERLCDRIGILDRGRMQAEGTRDELLRLTGEVDQVHLAGAGAVAAAAESIRLLPGVVQVAAEARSLTVTVPDASTVLAGLVSSAVAAGMSLSDVDVTRPDLESVFLHLTGRALRD